MTPPTLDAWVVLVPVKHGDVAKSRLRGVTSAQRADLARAFPADCVGAALASPRVGAVVAITDDARAAEHLRSLGARVIADEPDAGLNPALEHARDVARRDYDDPPVVVLSGDLPALRADDLTRALDEAGAHARAFVADGNGAGTTMLSATRGADLDPRFGPDSRRRHLDSGAVELAGPMPGLRRDVDTWEDLASAVGLGVGPATALVLRQHDLRPA